MADTAANFAKLVPGFDFLQGLVKNAGAALPSIGQWVAPTLNPEELEKRIEELRTVQFWLEQNARMLGATIQALEVQRMTLSTLKTMNVQMDDLRESLKIRLPGGAADAPAEADAARRRRRPAKAAAAKKPAAAGRGRRRRSDAVVGRADQAVHAARRDGDEGRRHRRRQEHGRRHGQAIRRCGGAGPAPSREHAGQGRAQGRRAAQARAAQRLTQDGGAHRCASGQSTMAPFLHGHATHPDAATALALAAAQIEAQRARRRRRRRSAGST